MTVARGDDAIAAAEAAPVALVVSVSPGETRVARLEHGRCIAVTCHRPWAAAAGVVLLGRLGPRLPDRGGAFVDLGPWGDGVLDPADLTGAVPSQGAAVLVQVRQAARPDAVSGGKGARLTLAPALTSARLALGGRRPGAAVSRRLPDDAERARLLALVKDLVAPGESLVARTAAAGADSATLAADLTRLRADWADLKVRAAEASSPALLSPAPLDWEAVLSPHDPAPSVVLLDDPAARDTLAADLAHALGDGAVPPILTHADSRDLWEATGVADAVDAALSPVVPLPGGGRLVIEPTAALVAMDVDAGSGPPARANAEALAMVPAHLRLRGLAGHILVDLIPGGRGPRLTATARQALEQALAADPAAPRLAGISRLGLLELSRERRGPTLADMMHGPAAQAVAALRDAEREARATVATALVVTVSPPAAVLLRGPLAPVVADLRTRRGLTLKIRQGSVGVDAAPAIGPP